MKTIKILSVLFVIFALLTSAVNVRAEKTVFLIEQVKVDGTTVFEEGFFDDVVDIERGETVVVEVWVRGTDDPADPTIDSADKVRVEAEIGGYEHGDIEARTDVFTVEPGVTYKKTLRLNIPEDVDASQNYILHIEASDGDDFDRLDDIEVRISEKRHYLNIQDVIISPSTTLEAGKNVFAKVRLENLGDKKEEDIRVEMSIPELGLSTRTYIDELVPEEDEDNDDEETSMSSPEMFLKIPEDADGKYTLKFTVTYNRGHTTEEQVFDLLVRGGRAPSAPSATVSIDTTSQTIEAGKGVIYKLMFSNLGNTPVTYRVDVAGVSGWGSSRVDPDTVTVLPDSTADMFVFVAASETAQTASQSFSVNVMQDGQLVKQIGLRADVVGGKVTAPSDSYKNIRQGLEVGFIVLLIILVILGLILAARRLGGPKESMEEPTSKTYY